MKSFPSMVNLPPRPRSRRRKPESSAEGAAVLAAARRAKQDAEAAEARKLAAAVQWCRLHQVEDVDLAETWDQTPIPIAGEGAPLIAHGSVAEFAAVIGMSTQGGRSYLADAAELAYRLPEVYARTQDGTLPVWKARRLAKQTSDIPLEVVTQLDVQIAPLANTLSADATEKLVAETITSYRLSYPQEVADQFAYPQVVVDHRQVSFQGTVQIRAAVDLADGIDFEEALAADAEAQKLAGSLECLDARRAKAFGRLARGEAAGRAVTLYVHLPAETNPVALVENRGPHLLTQAQVAAWCGNPDVKVTVKPVIDLHDRLTSDSYEVPERIKEHVELRDKICAFPHCTRPARACQKDHTKAHAEGGETATDNLAGLCQHHHNLKTHTTWTYLMPEPGVFLWQSPHGYTFLKDHTGTHDLTPRTVDPPGS